MFLLRSQNSKDGVLRILRLAPTLRGTFSLSLYVHIISRTHSSTYSVSFLWIFFLLYFFFVLTRHQQTRSRWDKYWEGWSYRSSKKFPTHTNILPKYLKQYLQNTNREETSAEAGWQVTKFLRRSGRNKQISMKLFFLWWSSECVQFELWDTHQLSPWLKWDLTKKKWHNFIVKWSLFQQSQWKTYGYTKREKETLKQTIYMHCLFICEF